MVKARYESNPSSSSSKTTTTKKKKSGKKRLFSGPAAAMKSSKPEKPNPFETIWSRRKFQVLGRKRKGEERRVGLARSIAIEKRTKTLQKDYEESAKSSKFMDNRIGEKDDTLQEFDKAVLRLQRERRVKLKRTSKYNLPDGEEDDLTTYQAYSHSEVDDFVDEVPPDEDAFLGTENDYSESSNFLNLHGVNNSSENNFLDEKENNHKTKKQVMQELISKSKYYKAQKAKDKEEDDNLMEKLDKDFTSLAQTDTLVSLTQPNKMQALKALLNKNSTRQPSKEHVKVKAPSVDKELYNKEKPDAYDKLVKEMVLDMRARPSDRTKTPEEIAQEERERLESLEEERKKRMLANDAIDYSDEGSDGGEDTHKSVTKKLRPISGDDLGDSFSVDDKLGTNKGWVDDIYEKKDENDSDEDSSEDSESQEYDDEENDDDGDGSDDGEGCGNMSIKEWEQSDDEELNMIDNDNESMDVRKEYSHDSRKVSARKLPSVEQNALPFVIEAPKNLEELCSLLDNRSDIEVVEAINRIRACNSVRLAAENRRKMQVFYGVLLQYFAVLASRRPVNIKIINSLTKPLIEMSIDTPYFAAICARQRLINIRNRFCDDIKIPDKSCWPSLKTLLLLRLWSLIFPCSDFRHVVMTPLILLMCEYLMRCPIVSARDIAVGTFVCSMVLSVAKQSRKFFPEALSFIQTLLLSAIAREGLSQKYQGYHLLELKSPNSWLHINNQVDDVHPIDFYMIMDMPLESPFFVSDDFKSGLLVCTVETLKGFIGIYDGLSSFSEMFMPFSALMHEVLRNPKLPVFLREKMESVINLMKEKTREHQMLRTPLQLLKQKPAPIKLLNPKFEENFVKGRDYDPDRERAEAKKLKKLLKREAKGAARELRKDNHFIYKLKERDRLLEEEERAEKYGKARAFLQEQEHAFKSGQLGKGSKKRRK